MRRLTMTSLAMIGGLLLAPACGAVLGIDDERILETEPSSSTSSASSSGMMMPDANVTPPAVCTTACGKVLPVQGTCTGTTGDTKCVFQCGPYDFFCNGDDVQCPVGHDCVVRCTGKSCNNISCTGGRSCTFDCTDAECRGATCNSATCHFICGADGCSSKDDEVRCGPTVRDCKLTCVPEAKTCKGIRCCKSATTTCPDESICASGNENVRRP